MAAAEIDLTEEEEPQVEAELTALEYPWLYWTDDPDEWRRAYIVQAVGLDYGVAYLQEVFEWMKSGRVPVGSKPRGAK